MDGGRPIAAIEVTGRPVRKPRQPGVVPRTRGPDTEQPSTVSDVAVPASGRADGPPASEDGHPQLRVTDGPVEEEVVPAVTPDGIGRVSVLMRVVVLHGRPSIGNGATAVAKIEAPPLIIMNEGRFIL